MDNEKQIFFGDRNSFAIRYIPDHKYKDERGTVWYYAFLHLVIDGQLIGDPGESCCAETWTYHLGLYLKRIKNGELKHAEFLDRPDDEIFQLIWKSNQSEDEFDPAYSYLPQLDNSAWYCALSIDETTDAYLITATEDGTDLKFIWQGWRQPCPEDLLDKLFSKNTDKNFVIATFEECITAVRADFINYKELP